MNSVELQLVFKVFTLIITLAGWRGAAANQDTSTFPAPRPVTTTSEYKPHMAAKGGLTSFDDGYPARGSFGFEVGYQPYIPFGLALEAMFTDQTRKVPTPGAQTVSRSRLIAKGTYNFGGSHNVVKYSHGGVMVGPVFDRTESGTRAVFGWGPTVGFDFPLSTFELGNGISIGADVSYLMVSGGRPDNVNVDGLLKYWF